MAKKGGQFRYVLEGVKDNDTFVVPAGCIIDGIVAKVVGGALDNVAVGTTDGGVDVVANVASLAVGLAPLTVIKNVFSMTADQTVYVTATVGAGETLDLFVQMSKIN